MPTPGYNPPPPAAQDRSLNDTSSKYKSQQRALQQLHTLANCLRQGLYRLATEVVSPFPQGMWICRDREVLFDVAYNPLWQRWKKDGRVEAADPHEWVKFQTDEFFFQEHPRLPFHQDYEGMKRLRAIVLGWVGR
jgi:hypothetical protein